MNSLSVQDTEVKQQIFTAEFTDLLTSYTDKIAVLSLDCFDTLLWRKTKTPSDVFFALQNEPLFKELGFTAIMRIQAESQARKMRFLETGSSEVTLDNIYREHFPNLSDVTLTKLIEEEMMLEKIMCYGFPDTITLIDKAYALGLKIIIVSDTYFTQAQLLALLQATVPTTTIEKISHIFCSSDYKKSKSSGLFHDVMSTLNLPANKILHIGDNQISDYLSPKKLSIHAAHLIQHNAKVEEVARLGLSITSFIDPSIRYQKQLMSPFHGVLAQHTTELNSAEAIIGYASLGQIMYPFARFICDEISALQKAGKKPKPVFLLRDAYLPFKACEAMLGHSVGTCVRISRFSAYAASFRNTKDIDTYLLTSISSNRFDAIAKQLLIPDATANDLINSCLKTNDPALAFIQQVHQTPILEMIFHNSKQYCKRLYNYLKNAADLQPGDIMMMIDLGYSGTAQRQLEPVLRDEFNIDITGRYLIQLSVPGWNTSRKGLLNTSWCDDRTMHMLVTYIALLEQLCTTNEKSVIDYDKKGNPIYNETSMHENQNQKLALIQNQCIKFIKDTETFFEKTGINHSIENLRFTALNELGRLLFLPTMDEIQFLKEFQFDVNLGTKDIFNIFDIEKGLNSLRRRGIYSLFMEKNAASFRTNVPTEFRYAGIELSFMLMSHHRFSVDLKISDTTFRQTTIKAIILMGQKNSQIDLQAQFTHDGYYSLIVPLGTNHFQLGLLLGQHYKWLQIESAEIIPLAYYLTSNETLRAENCLDKLIFQDMHHHENNLYQSMLPSSFVMLPGNIKNSGEWIFRFVFRPIV